MTIVRQPSPRGEFMTLVKAPDRPFDGSIRPVRRT